jgi:hypothetical protein
MGVDTVKIFCPKCNQVYHPPPIRSRAGTASGVDGASFGTTFPHLFLMTFANLVPDPLPAESSYIPRVFGFRVHKSARSAVNGRLLPSEAEEQVTAQDGEIDGRRSGSSGRKRTASTKENGPAFAIDSAKRRRRNNTSN